MIQIDTQIEVREDQYKLLKTRLSGIVAHRKENGKFYIKILIEKYISLVESYLLSTN